MKLERIRNAGTHIMGRVACDERASFWSDSTDGYAAPFNEIPKIVFSKTIKEATGPSPGSRAGILPTISQSFAASPAETSWLGGTGFAQMPSRTELVDEDAIINQPVAYGGDKSLFRRLAGAQNFKILAQRRYDNAAALHLYQSH